MSISQFSLFAPFLAEPALKTRLPATDGGTTEEFPSPKD
jgi:hypothetical protein